jgi:hypothetical protein
VDQWFDRTAFPVVPLGAYRFGNSGRNILDGPGLFNVNTSLSRRFKFAESKALQFRMESFNLPNHTNFILPENRVDVLSRLRQKSAGKLEHTPRRAASR